MGMSVFDVVGMFMHSKPNYVTADMTTTDLEDKIIYPYMLHASSSMYWEIRSLSCILGGLLSRIVRNFMECLYELGEFASQDEFFHTCRGLGMCCLHIILTFVFFLEATAFLLYAVLPCPFPS